MTDIKEPFTTRMRKATRKIHSVSDALVNAKFALSLKDDEVWSGGLFAFYHIFAFLEEAKERLNMPDLNMLYFSKILYRKQVFEEDLAHYLGENWQSREKSMEIKTYLTRLEDLVQRQPILLLAYVYHLYLGLLSGGQILMKKRRLFGEKNNTENFYADKVTDFGDTDLHQLKRGLRYVMNEIAERMSDHELDALIDESNQVFVMNNSLVNSIGGQNKVLWDMILNVSLLLVVVFGGIYAYKYNG